MTPTNKDTLLETSASALLETLGRTVWQRQVFSPYESCYCALVLLLDPRRPAYEIVESVPATSHEMDDCNILNATANLGYFARDIKIVPADIDARLMPCVFMPDKGDPVVIIRREDDAIVIYDGKTRRVRALPTGEKTARASGTAWTFSYYDRNQQKISRFMRAGTGHSWFRALIGRFSPTFTQILFSGVLLNIVALAAPLYMMAVYDLIISPADKGPLLGLTVGVIIALVTELLLRRVRSRALSWLSARLDTLVGTKIFAHLIGLSPDLVEHASVAAQIARIKTFESVRDLFSGAVFLSFLEIPYVIIALILIWAVAGSLFLVPLLVLGGYAVLFGIMRRRIKIVIRLAAKASSGRQQFSIETFEKMTGIRANGLAGIWARKFSDLSSREIIMTFQLGWIGMMSETLAHAFTLLAAVMTVGVGAHLIWTGEMTTGALIASMMLVWRVLTPFYSLCSMIPRLEQLRNSIIQVNDLMDLDTEADAAPASARLPALRGHLSFSGVTFGYDTSKDPIFHTLDFDAKPGSFVALIGRNGAGKTSLLKLAKGLYKPLTGAVRIDGFDMRQLDPLYLRRQIAYVPQKPEFLTAPLIDNLRMAHPLAADQDIERALRLADVWEDVQKLEDGLHTVIAPEKIGSLAPRLSLARAYLHGGPLMLIDEMPATLLHSQAGKNLKRYIEKSQGLRTVIMVTSHDDFLEKADLIVELLHGGRPRYIGKAPPPLLKESA